MVVDFVMFESCGLEGGLEIGNLDGAAVCPFFFFVSENEETVQVMNAELARLTEFQLKKYGMLKDGMCEPRSRSV